MASQVETIFSTAIDLADSERAAYLDSACGNDLNMRREIEALLIHGPMLATTMLRRAAGFSLLTTSAEILPIRLERYDLEARIGEGSFGVVYRASQHTPIKRKVAVKVLRPGLDGAQIVRRFEVERQTLAALDHVNIARLFDAGNMPDGRPYFVMELLDGLPITQYCDAKRLGLRERLDLFLQVCAAVEHAHRRAVLHRDLKPANILVTESESSPVVRVIDFGIAKVLGDEIPLGTLSTDVGRLIGTPEYMSPEQIDGERGDIDTRADLYALGMLLYEMICGRLPFDSKQLRSLSISKMRRVISEVMPPPPSRAWDVDNIGVKEAAEARGMTAPAMLAALKNEIEWIPMRAIRKSPSDRYGSVSELAQDVQNYLKGTPLLAGPDSAMYRARKYFERHRVAVLATCVIAFLLIGGIVGTSIGMLTARRQRAVAQAQQRRAEVQLADTLIARGQYASDQQHFIDSWDAFAQAREVDSRLGNSTMPADLGLLGVVVAADPPEAILQAPVSGCPWLAFIDDGRTLIRSGTTSAIEWDLSSRNQARKYPFQVLAISPDNRALYTQDQSHRLAVRDRETLAVLRELKSERGDVFDRMFISPDGHWLIGTHTYQHFTVWDARTGERKGRYKFPEGDPVASAFTSDNARAVIVSSTSIAIEWDLASATEVRRIQVSERGANDIFAAPQQGKFAVATWDHQANLFDVTSGRKVQTFGPHDQEVNRVAFSPDGGWLISAGADSAVKVWNVSTGKLQRAMFGHRGPVGAIAFAPDSRHFATASMDGEIRLWDLEIQRPQFELIPPQPRDKSILCFSPDERLLARAAGKSIDVWNLDQRRRIADLPMPPMQDVLLLLQFSPDSEHLYGMQLEAPATVYQWDAHGSSGPRALASLGGRARGFAVSADGKQLIAYGDTVGLLCWDLERKAIRWERRTQSREWHFYTTSPDFQFVAKLSDDASVEVIRTSDGSTVRKFKTAETHTGVAHVEFVPNHPKLLVWAPYFDTRPHLMNFVTDEQLWVAGTEQGQRAGWFVTPDGNMVALESSERQVDFLDITDGHPLFSTTLPPSTAQWGLSPHLRWITFTGPDYHPWVADLRQVVRLTETRQNHPL